MSFASLSDLRSQLGASPIAEAYREKMLHPVPPAEVVDREAFIRDVCIGKRVLEFGASGSLSRLIRGVASLYLGVDRQDDGDRVVGFDLDDVCADLVPSIVAPEIIICGEILEHLTNPGWFLTRLRRQFPGIPTVITVPNAFSESGRRHILTGVENVNLDHCCWYSFRTLKTLLGKVGYRDFEFAWYRGAPLVAEGLLVRCIG